MESTDSMTFFRQFFGLELLHQIRDTVPKSKTRHPNVIVNYSIHAVL